MKNNSLFAIAILLVILSVVIIAITVNIRQQCDKGPRMMGMENNMKDTMQRIMSGILSAGITPNDLPDPDSRGAKLMDQYCTQCHALTSPSMHTEKGWPTIADRMFARMAMMSGMGGMRMMHIENPSPDEKQVIMAYLLAHAMKPVKLGALSSPQSPGAIAFIHICSRCHAIPDPKSHTAAEWPKIVDRMRSHIRTMGKGKMTNKQEKEISDYLVSNAK